MILVRTFIEVVYKDCVVVSMVGGQYVLVTAYSSDGEASSVVTVKLGCRFGPNVHFV